jgi:hypothetical protein
MWNAFLNCSLHDASLLATSKLVHYLILKKHYLVKCASKLANYFNSKLVCELSWNISTLIAN